MNPDPLAVAATDSPAAAPLLRGPAGRLDPTASAEAAGGRGNTSPIDEREDRYGPENGYGPDLEAMRRAWARVGLEVDIGIEAEKRALRIVQRTMPDAHPFHQFDAVRPIKRRLIQKLRVKHGVAEAAKPERAKEAA